MLPIRAVTTRSGARAIGPWQATNPAKRWTERFFLLYSPVWVTWALCILVPFQLYEVGAWAAPWEPAGRPLAHRTGGASTRTGAASSLDDIWQQLAASRKLLSTLSSCCAAALAVLRRVGLSGDRADGGAAVRPAAALAATQGRGC